MNRIGLCIAAACVGVIAGCATTAQHPTTPPSRLQVTHLTCEHLAAPMGIDRAHPRFSWWVTAEAALRGGHQTAYQLVVGNSEHDVAAGIGEAWDSSEVASSDTLDIAYAGRPLHAHEALYWSVRAWDEKGVASRWSAPEMFSVGMLSPSDWKAQWIGLDSVHAAAKAAMPTLDGASWLMFGNDTVGDAPAETRWYEGTFELPPGAMTSATLLAAGDDKLECWVNNIRAGSGSWTDTHHPATEMNVAPFLHPGHNVIRAKVQNVKTGPTGLIARLTIRMADGSTKDIFSGQGWQAAPAESGPWAAAKTIGTWGMAPWGKITMEGPLLPPTVLVRKTFDVIAPVTRATLYLSALGNADAYVNGKRVSDDSFTPGWTDYAKRVYYRAYDVTSDIHQGSNVLGAELADGWFSGYVGYGHQRDHYGQKTRVAEMLRIEHGDGTAETIATGPGWRAGTGPRTHADFLMGESFDARLSLTAFDDAAWSPADVGTDEVRPLIQWHPGPPVRTYDTFVAQSMNEVHPNVWVLNLGQNFAGVAKLKLRDTTPAQKITLRFAERLNPDGTLYTTNLRGAQATDEYTCRGDGTPEDWTPRFTFHGFQYVEVTGLGRKPDENTLTGIALSSDTPLASAFDTSDPMLNRLHKNIYYTQRSNFIDVPTDCPQRDERLGWTADAHVYAQAATLNSDTHAFYDKWLVDLADAQRADGQFPMVAPLKVAESDGGPAWADAGTIVPWVVYEAYGDKALLARQYPSMKKFVDFCRTRSGPHVEPPAKYHTFGDWLSINAKTPDNVVYLAYFAQSTRLTAKAAEVLGKTDDAKDLWSLYAQIKASFKRTCMTEDGKIKGDTQTDYVLALAFGLLDGPDRDAAAQHLIAAIEKKDWHLSTGFLGTKELMPVLSEIGRADVAYKLLHNDTFPSWGFSIKQGATSIWERWDGWTPDKGFQDPGMNSFAHYSFGAVYRWMVEAIGGIRQTSTDFQDILLAPELDPKLTRATVAYDSPHGPIRSSWKRANNRLTWTVNLPANTTALIALPSPTPTDITESHHPLAAAPGLTPLATTDHRTLVRAEPGEYTFDIRNPHLLNEIAPTSRP